MVLALVMGSNVPGKIRSPSRSVATALLLAGVRALARVRAHVHGKVSALSRCVAAALLLARELALTHLKRGRCQARRRRRGAAKKVHGGGLLRKGQFRARVGRVGGGPAEENGFENNVHRFSVCDGKQCAW